MALMAIYPEIVRWCADVNMQILKKRRMASSDDPKENPEKSGKSAGLGLGGLGGHFYCKYYEKSGQKAAHIFSASL